MKHLNSKIRLTILVMAIDLAIITFAFLLAQMFMYFPKKYTPEFFDTHQVSLWIVFSVTTLTSMTVFGCNRTIWKYTSTSDVLRIIFAMFFTVVFLLIVKYGLLLSDRERIIENNIIILYAILSCLFLMIPRFYFKLIRATKHFISRVNRIDPNDKKVIIYGAGYTGRSIAEQFINNEADGYMPVAFIDDDETKRGSTISGIKVMGGRDKLHKTVKDFGADLIVIAIQETTKQVLKEIYQVCVSENVPVKIVPKILNADLAIKNVPLEIRDIRTEELLGRDEFETNVSIINHFIKGKVVLVTGGAGSIGSELCRQALHYNCVHLIILDAHENSVFLLNQELEKLYPKSRYSLEIANVRDKTKLASVFNKYNPDVVFHAAAYKHVPMMELSPVEAIKNNVFGTKNVIDQCNKSKVKNFVLISTDKAVNPANVMGASKRIAEMLVQYKHSESATRLAAVRFGNVLGSNGSVIGIFLEQIKEGGPITLTHKDIKRYFMTIPEAVRLVLQAGAFANGGDVFVLDMGEPVLIHDLAVDLIKMNGLQPGKDIQIEVTGLRAGEKLFEELKFDGESCDKTMHNGIFVCKLEPVNKEIFEKQLAKLKKSVDSEDDTEMLKNIFEIVPSIYREPPA